MCHKKAFGQILCRGFWHNAGPVSCDCSGGTCLSWFEPREDEDFVAIGRDYGPQVEKRSYWIMDIILENHDKPIMEKLKLANDTLYSIPWIADPDH